MHGFVGRLAGPLVGVGEDLTTEFEARLADSGSLAVRVAYGVLLCLFYLALLALGEVLPPGQAYIGAAVASSLLIVCYSISILHSYARAGSIAALLAAEHSVLYVVLRMEDYALLAGTTALFVVLAAIMFFTRHVDWFAQEAGKQEARA